MNFVIDFSAINELLVLPIDVLMIRLFWLVGWIPIAIVFIWGSWLVFVFSRQAKYSTTLRYSLLAIDIPRGNDQSLKAVESIFTYLAGAHDPPDLIEKYWEGKYQLGVSFEIVGIDGYTQFLIRTPVPYRDVIETAIYSIYPDAEISEVNDYTEGIPMKYPDPDYDVWGGEMILVKPWVYPIKTYKEFEIMGTKPGEGFKDPMATLMDLYSSLKKGEQFWFQLIVYPTGFDWPKKGDAEISKIIGEKVKAPQGFGEKLLAIPDKIIDTLAEGLLGITFITTEKKEEKDSFRMMNLKPKQKKQIEAIQDKISKLGFEAKLRFVYVAKREVKNKPKAIFGIVGWIKQFMDLDLNNFKPDMDMTATSAHYFFTKYRKAEKQTRIMTAYRDRTGTRGRKRFILTAEELATLWHFPAELAVKAPLIQKAQGRKAEPPMSLPIAETPAADSLTKAEREEYESIFTDLKELQTEAVDEAKKDGRDQDIFSTVNNDNQEPKEKNTATAKGEPPTNLPFA